jgi:predicted RNA-binding Zn-ribbon protein involved in translation (DUF1610 family)
MNSDEEESFKKPVKDSFDQEIRLEIVKDKIDEISRKIDFLEKNLNTEKIEKKKFQIFLDTADVEEIRKAHSWGVIDGVTTNPTLVCKTGRSFEECIDEIVSIVDGPISAEVISLDAEGIVKEARELANFLALIVDTTTKTMPATLTLTEIRCFKKGCHGLIKSELTQSNNEIHWKCPDCGNEGVISHWQGSRWDNKK